MLPVICPTAQAAAVRQIGTTGKSRMVRMRLLPVGQISAHDLLHADAPLALGRRRCSSSRGMISTKLQGRVR